MLKFTRTSIINFDFEDALSFEGETGPYVQYAIVRAANIFRKAGTTAEESLAAVGELELSGMMDGESTPDGKPDECFAEDDLTNMILGVRECLRANLQPRS